MAALNEDRNLLGHFLRELVEVKSPAQPRKLSVLEQQYPGEEEPDEDELERRGIPMDGFPTMRVGASSSKVKSLPS